MLVAYLGPLSEYASAAVLEHGLERSEVRVDDGRRATIAAILRG